MTAIGKTQVSIWGFYHGKKYKFKNCVIEPTHSFITTMQHKEFFVVQLDEPDLESDRNVVY